jgi:adenine-specific DNA-methyltransferase
LSRGILLADEVGLGKTIEAGIVLAQKWAENKRRILLILPASLRKQWLSELEEKFYLPAFIMEKKSFEERKKGGRPNPFEADDEIVITSYQFASGKADWVQKVAWDMVVIDEAHRVRNSWKKDSITGQALKKAVGNKRKILLTATPLQNSMMELFGLLSFIDPQAFGDELSFKLQYLKLAEEGRFEELRQRIAPYCHRTLRRQVVEYIKYTKRTCITQGFDPGEDEQSLYEDVSAYLQRPDLIALPSGQRQLMTLLLRKLLASSTYAIAGALGTIIARLEERKEGLEAAELAQDMEDLDEELEEWDLGEEATAMVDPRKLEAEIEELKSFRDRARATRENAKGQNLVTAIGRGFEEMERLGAQRKAIIFTESRKTQDYIVELLSNTSFANDIVLFNGTNSDVASKAILRDWLKANEGSGKVSGSPSADMRAALVDKFREGASIMIATEAAAEGVNLQFCSLVINYDLPWNPQRIEQRIGRCHRYGQKHDVVVINFINQRNKADQRVYELLDQKFRLFDGVFGASDEVLGSIGSGLDFEKRILEIYQTCRDPEAIDTAFDALRSEYSIAIDAKMSDTKQKLLENFDDEVRARLKLREEETNKLRSSHERSLYYLTRHILGKEGNFDNANWGFTYMSQRYSFGGALSEADQIYRLGNPLAQDVIDRAKTLPTKDAHIVFRYNWADYIGSVRCLIGKEGWISAELLIRESPEFSDEELLLSGCFGDGTDLTQETILKLFQVGGRAEALNGEPPPSINGLAEQRREAARVAAQAQNMVWLTQEMDKVEAWGDDLKAGLELEIKDLDLQMKAAKRAKVLAATLEEKLVLEKDYRALTKKRDAARLREHEAQDEIDARSSEIIEKAEAKLKSTERIEGLFRIKWSVV